MQNNEKKLDRRTAYTRMVIQDTLFKLLETKHLPQITVKELCEGAEINRATFYRNYEDIYDLFQKIEEELTSSAFATGNLESDRYRLLEIIYENQIFYREFFDAHLESEYVKQVAKKMCQEMRQLLIKRGTYDEKSFGIAYQYNYYGVVGVIRDWLERGCPESPKDFGDIVYGIVERQWQ